MGTSEWEQPGSKHAPVEEQRALAGQLSVASGSIAYKVGLQALGHHALGQRPLRRLPHSLALGILCAQERV